MAVDDRLYSNAETSSPRRRRAKGLQRLCLTLWNAFVRQQSRTAFLVLLSIVLGALFLVYITYGSDSAAASLTLGQKIGIGRSLSVQKPSVELFFVESVDSESESGFGKVAHAAIVHNDGSVVMRDEVDHNMLQADPRNPAIVFDVKGNLLQVRQNLKQPLRYAKAVAEELEKKVISNTVFNNPDPQHLHGIYGVDTNGKPLWEPKPIRFKMTEEQKVEAHTGYCFNTRVSQSLPLDRPVPDFADWQCRKFDYEQEELPLASVIIIFHNEDLSVLLRSVHSVLDRTPPKLLKEIILVDDDSNHTSHPWLGEDLDVYLQTVPKTVIRRMSERQGLMGARVRGADWATGDVLVFLDSHIETTRRWLEPMLKRIKDYPKTIVVPMIGSIDPDTFKLDKHGLDIVAFTWSLGSDSPPNRKVGPIEPEPSPVMAGGLFAVNRKWFYDLGGYDPGMRLYGLEEKELGFKVWQCGGRLEVIPCSYVAHVFRTAKYWAHQVYKVPGEEIHRNRLRVADVWMDEYGELVRITTQELPEGMTVGDTSHMKQIRSQLNCKSFKWYLDNVYPEMPVPELKGAKFGAIRNIKYKLCLDSMSEMKDGSKIGVYPCHGQKGTQAFVHDGAGLIWAGPDLMRCLKKSGDGSIIAKRNCGSYWQYESKQLHYGDKCLAVENGQLSVAECEPGVAEQQWAYDPV